ncbi:cytochrome oxidase c assembly-domain-containing protein [Trichophaea hybrida]|nr:cytochrome oxidase c assembly-domain-containing protein [Trichophaea hybrida]
MSPPRSVADATRFTPTGPHAFTPSPSPASGAPKETPQQRVRRLREAAWAAKEAKAEGTILDRIIDRGRVWADRAHRVTAIGLISATVLCGAVTVYAFTDMILYNRRRKAEQIEQLRANPPPPSFEPIDSVTPAPAAGPWKQLKAWALSGMTPADQEYKTAFEKARDEERKEAEKLMVPIVVEATKEGKDKGERIDRLGADDLVKEEQEKGGNVGTLASLTGWWSGR